MSGYLAMRTFTPVTSGTSESMTSATVLPHDLEKVFNTVLIDIHVDLPCIINSSSYVSETVHVQLEEIRQDIQDDSYNDLVHKTTPNTFCGVGLVQVRGNELELDTGFKQKRFEAAGTFIVHHLVLGSEVAVGEVGVEDARGSDEFLFVTRID